MRGRRASWKEKRKKQKRRVPWARVGAGLVLLTLLGFAYVKNATGKGLTQRLMGMEMALLTNSDQGPEEEEDDRPWELEEGGVTQTSAEPTAEPVVTTSLNAAVAVGDAVTTMMPPDGIQPRIILYNTHSNEAFRKVDGDNYEESSQWRTLNSGYNIQKVAQNLTYLLSQEYHLPVMFESTDHEQGKFYTTSYERSLATMKKDKEKYPVDLFIDVHRDGTGSSGVGDVVTVDGKPCAKVMFVIGTGEGKTGQGFKERPEDWEANKRVADAVIAELNTYAKGLGKTTRVKTGRYNQHMAKNCILIEIGHNQNTLQEVMNSVPYIAKAMNAVFTRDLDIQPYSVP